MYLEVAVRDSAGVQVLEDDDDLRDVEDLEFLSEFGDVELDEVDELAALAVLLDEVEVGLVLEGVLQLHDPAVLQLRQQFLLHHRLVLLLLPL